jgi:diguanylate cyclase (GGDEF)-like protein
MYLDIDNFKQLNDHYGHAAGDQVLVCLASRLRDFTRQSDLVARLGGDEFLIVLPGLNSQEHVLGIANHILQVVSHTILLPSGEEIQPALSLGATLCFSFDLDLSDAISTADKAMYQAKKQAGSSSHYISSKNYPF